jgi:amino acid transporter
VVSQGAEHLRAGQLGTADLTASTLANIGLGENFYFAFGVIAVTAGVAAPLTILAAGVAIVLLAFTVAEFTKVEPSAGSFITYVETSLGARAGVVTAVLVVVGYTVAIAGIFTMSGGMVTLTLAHYTSLHMPWEPLALVLTAGAIGLTMRGVKLSTKAVGLAVLVQVAIMVTFCVVVLVDRRAHLSAIPFSWSHLTHGLAGLSAGFPLALYMLIGWENGPALAEETRDPRRTVPRALHISIAIGVALFVFFAYATVTGFNYDVSSIGRSSIPFLAMADRYLGGVAVLAWIGGMVAVLATLIAGANSQARMLFDGGRSGLLPARLGHLRQPGETPVNALLVMAGGGLGIIAVWWVAHLIDLDTSSTNPVGLYAECSTMGTIVILFVYLLTTLSLPVFMWRRHRESFSTLRHMGIPVLGALTLIVPFVELCKPGQPTPYSEFPYIALAVLVVAIATACVTVHRHSSTGSGEGTTFSESSASV